MSSHTEQGTREYIEKHNIVELLNLLTSMLFYYRPDSPREFLFDQLDRLKVSKGSRGNGPCLFNQSNLDALFGVLDPCSQGSITRSQYTKALKTLGIKHFREFPDGADDDRILQETFSREATAGLLRAASTYQ
ncbi:hypothetical protein DNTS_024691 [Danionella cerebrum]|uniref:EFCAB10 C-terminal EF-hand domain-containing protein n=1 Tax=Danionella cerebrum TaxID=2873325 RepID=A0A553QLX1_9TELE|nr:hypothetical protein DNTS_024691 [Danionella translucida]